MGVLDNIKDKVKQIFNFNKSNADFLQYIHIGSCKNPCVDCPKRNLKIYKNGEEVFLPAHFGCDCKYKDIETKSAGSISNKGFQSPDVYLKAYGKLPDYYISREDLYALGYKWGEPPRECAPGMMIYGGVYENKDGHLPSALGRIWYEADINYHEGQRNRHRIVWSNDGLIFVTYDHYHTFYEIT